MRRERKRKQVINFTVALIVVAMISYIAGFDNGVESVYKKAINDRDFLKTYSESIDKSNK